MTSSASYAVRWTETALKLAERIKDVRVRRLITERAGALAREPEKQGKPLIGEFAGFRSIRAVGQRYRIVYRVDRGEVVVFIVAVGQRKASDHADVYELARKLLRQGLLARASPNRSL